MNDDDYLPPAPPDPPRRRKRPEVDERHICALSEPDRLAHNLASTLWRAYGLISRLPPSTVRDGARGALVFWANQLVDPDGDPAPLRLSMRNRGGRPSAAK